MAKCKEELEEKRDSSGVGVNDSKFLFEYFENQQNCC